MGGVTGDLGALNWLGRKLLRLPIVATRIARKVAPAISEAAAQSYDARTSPDGSAWPDEHSRNRSGKLRAGATTITASGKRLRGGGSLPRYARYQKPPLFIPSRSMPEPWAHIVEEAVVPEVRKELSL